MDPTTFRLMSGGGLEPYAPVSISFTASNYYPTENTSTTLYWTVTNSVSVSINYFGSVNPSGSATQTATGSRTYFLYATGLDGISYQSSITIAWQLDANCPSAWRNMGWC